MKRKRLQSDSFPHLNSSGALRFKISLSKGEIEADHHEDKAMEPAATSSNLLKVLLEVHRQFVKRDAKGIFANPVTLDIAPDYFSVISSPMDLGTMHSKLLSRRCYATVGQYLSDLRLMCTNAMRYNPPETVYYQKARKLLAFGEKLLSSVSLQRICTDLGLPEGLTAAEMSDLEYLPQVHRLWTPTATSASSAAPPHYFTPPSQFCETTRLSSRKARPPGRRPSDCAPSPPSLLPARLSPEFSRSPSTLELRQSPPSLKRSSFSTSSTGGGYDASDINSSKPSTPRSLSGTELQQPISPQPSSQSQQQQQPTEPSTLRASSSHGAFFEQDSEVVESSLSPAPSTPQSASPISDYASASASQRQSGQSSNRNSRLSAPASAPVLFTSGGRRQSHPPERLENSRPVSRADASRIIGRKSVTRKPPNITPKKLLRSSTDCKSSGRRKSHLRSVSKSSRCYSPTPTSPQQSSTATSPAPKSSPFRTYAEDAWSFSDSMTDLTPPDQILTQVREAARKAHEAVIARYCPAIQSSVKAEDAESAVAHQKSLQKIVYLDVSQPGRISAVHCPLAETRNPEPSQPSLETEEKPLPVSYPPALVQLLTGRGPGLHDQVAVSESSDENSATRPPLPKSAYHGLIEQMTSQEVNTLHALSKLRYKEDEPIAATIHGPLAIFDPSELAEMFDVYGGDPVTVEYVLSLLTFVESVGPWARREITKKLDAATSGLHSQMLASFLAAKKTSVESTNWMSTAGLTIDPPKSVTPPAPKVTSSNDSDTSAAQSVSVSCPLDSNAGSTASIQPPSSTHTVLHTRQTATVLPLQRSGQTDTQNTSQENNHPSVSVPTTVSVQPHTGLVANTFQLVESTSPVACSSNSIPPDPVGDISVSQSTTLPLMPSTASTENASAPSSLLVVACPSGTEQASHTMSCTGLPPTTLPVSSADQQYEILSQTEPPSVSGADNMKSAIFETLHAEHGSSLASADFSDDNPGQPEPLLVRPSSPCADLDNTERQHVHTAHLTIDCEEVNVLSEQTLAVEKPLQPVGTKEKLTEETSEKGKQLAVQGQTVLLRRDIVDHGADVLPRPASAQSLASGREPKEEDGGNGRTGNRERSVSAPPSLIDELDKHYSLSVLTDPN
uniref:Bromo domain-containing protein n=3 Tax=Schistocephalus solidus TaxID=70667 RepID=A0A0V0J5I2_SCHSO